MKARWSHFRATSLKQSPSRALSSLQYLRQRLTLVNVAAALLLLALGCYMIREANRSVVMVDVFFVPKEYDALGVSSAVFTRRMLDAIQRIENRAAFEDSLGNAKTDLMLESDTRTLLDFEVPQTKVSFRTLVQLAQEALGWEPRVVGGEVTFPWATRSRFEVSSSKSGLDQTAIIFRVTQGTTPRSLIELNLPTSDPDEVVKKVAEAIVSNIDPFVFAVYSQKTDPCGAMRVARDMTKDDHIPNRGPRSKSEAYLLWGYVLFWLNQMPDAKDKFTNALISDPTSALAHNAIGNVLSTQGDRNGAESEYLKAVALRPKWVTPRISLAADLAHDGKWDEASVVRHTDRRLSSEA
jgi:tetratricopeptide (TPR) repeat protein